MSNLSCIKTISDAIVSMPKSKFPATEMSLNQITSVTGGHAHIGFYVAPKNARLVYMLADALEQGRKLKSKAGLVLGVGLGVGAGLAVTAVANGYNSQHVVGYVSSDKEDTLSQ